jgi:signal transduction histidine kinase
MARRKDLPAAVDQQQYPSERLRLPFALGLRAQIILALCAVFALSVALLGITATRLTRHAMERDRTAFAEILARGLATTLDQLPDLSDERLDAVVEDFLQDVPNKSIRLTRKNGAIYSYGPVPTTKGIEITLATGDKLELWLPYLPIRSIAPLGNLLLFYVALTGAGVALLTYIALTYWIVRPIERVIQSSERLAAGSLQVRAPISGAAEVTRLAVAFNQMAAQLQADRQSLEQRLRELEASASELKTAQQQIVHGEKLATVGRLAAGVAHEIGNPLAAILGLVELIQGDTLSKEEQAEFLKRIRLETERIHRIIRDLLDFSRRSVDSEELGMTSDLRQVIDDAVNLVRPLKEMRGVEIIVSRPKRLARVVGPQHKLTQVLLNLLLNAADALSGDGKISIQVESSQSDGFVTLAVSDNGPGIDYEIFDTMFEPFTTTKPPGKGTGLGLAVCHTLIESVGGTLSAANLPEGGARFEIQLKVQSSG